MSFVEAVEKFNMNQYTTTANGMPMRFSSGSRCVDYFSKIGSVGKIQDSLDLFIEAVNENPETAFRILQWSNIFRGTLSNASACSRPRSIDKSSTPFRRTDTGLRSKCARTGITE